MQLYSLCCCSVNELQHGADDLRDGTLFRFCMRKHNTLKFFYLILPAVSDSGEIYPPQTLRDMPWRTQFLVVILTHVRPLTEFLQNREEPLTVFMKYICPTDEHIAIICCSSI